MATDISEVFTTGDGRRITKEDIIQTYRNTFHGNSSPVGCSIEYLGQNAYNVTCYSENVDLDTLTKPITSNSYFLLKNNDCIESVRRVSGPHERVELLSANSSDNKFLATVSRQQVLKIWDQGRFIKSVEISELDVHGDIITNVLLGNIQWSEDGMLLYVCQPKKPKPVSFLKKPKSKSGDGSNASGLGDNNQFEEYTRVTHWGEAFNNISHTMVAVLDVNNGCEIKPLDMKGFSLAHSQWLNNGKSIVSTAYEDLEPRLGMIYMNNRPSKIVIHDYAQGLVIKQIEDPSLSYHSPRVAPLGDRFIYQSNRTFGPHIHTTRLHLHEVETGSSKKLETIDLSIVDLPFKCFSSDGRYVLFTGVEYNIKQLFLLSLEESSLSKLQFPTVDVNLLAFSQDIIVATGSDHNATLTPFVANFKPGDVVAWHQIEDCTLLSEIEYKSIKTESEDNSYTLSAMLIGPTQEFIQDRANTGHRGKIIAWNELPTIVMVHGGPHSAFTIGYIPICVFFARLGCKTLLINYKGSTGVNQKYLEDLCGRIGDTDINDCLHMIRTLVARGSIDAKKLILYGGSHGGFIACHLSCQEEFKFLSAIIRNPVVDLTMMVGSDIPDWLEAEALNIKDYNPARTLSLADMTKLYEISPMFKGHLARVPTFMALGSEDQRVKMIQGERWIDLLQAKGVDTLCKIYPDKHALDKIEVYADCAITSAIWLLSHL